VTFPDPHLTIAVPDLSPPVRPERSSISELFQAFSRLPIARRRLPLRSRRFTAGVRRFVILPPIVPPQTTHLLDSNKASGVGVEEPDLIVDVGE